MKGWLMGGGNVNRRRGAVVVFVLVLLPVMIGFGALVVDVGVLYNTRADLQNAADAAALAGATALASDEMTQVRLANSTASGDAVTSMSVVRSGDVSSLNSTWGTTTTVLDVSDITIGRLDLTSAQTGIVSGVPASSYNAVEVVARRTLDGQNGPVQLLFARIFGRSTSEMTAKAVAAYDDRVAGYDMSRVPGALPITISQTVFESGFSPSGTDDEHGDGEGHEDDHHGEQSDGHEGDSGHDNGGSGDSATTVAWTEWNGVPALRITPSNQSDNGNGGDEENGHVADGGNDSSHEGNDHDNDGEYGSDGGSAPGNFGLLNIGSGNQGVPGQRAQIEGGVSPDDYEQQVGTSVLTFQGSDGSAASYAIGGNPGLDASLESSFQTRVGSVVGFFLHNSVSGQGANASYNISGLRYGRVVAVNLTGSPDQRGLWIQPVSFVGDGVILSSTATSTGGLTGRIVLAR